MLFEVVCKVRYQKFILSLYTCTIVNIKQSFQMGKSTIANTEITLSGINIITAEELHF